MQKDQAPFRRAALRKPIGSSWRNQPFGGTLRNDRLWVDSRRRTLARVNGSYISTNARLLSDRYPLLAGRSQPLLSTSQH